MNFEHKFDGAKKSPKVIALAQEGEYLAILLVQAQELTLHNRSHAGYHVDDVLTDNLTLARNVASTGRRSRDTVGAWLSLVAGMREKGTS